MAIRVLHAPRSSTPGIVPVIIWMSTIIGAKRSSARLAHTASTLVLRQSNTCSNATTGGRIGVDHARKVSRMRIICARCVFLVIRINLDKADSAQHLNSSVHRGTDISCPFCKRGFATATGVTHHLETGSCPKARSLNRDTILTEIRRRDPNHIITKKLLTYHQTESSITATSASWNRRTGMYECYLCHRGFRELKSLNNHVNSPTHKENVYHCPGRKCDREFKALAALFNHLESEKCGAVRFDAVQRNVGDMLSGRRLISFA